MKLFDTNFCQNQIVKASGLIQKGDIGFGSLSLELEKLFKKYSGNKYNISTNSASAAAFMIFDYLKSIHGTCDIYTPSIGFTSPVWAAKHLGHNIFFVDVNDHLLFDYNDYLNKRGGRNANQAVIMPILYGGLSDIPNKKTKGDEIIVTDSAHCVTPKIKSHFTFFSFHPRKPICSSDGGMISTDDQNAFDFFNCYRNFGRQNNKKSYDIIQSGFKFYMNNLNCCIAIESSKTHRDRLQERKDNFKLLKKRTAIFDDILFNSNLLPHDKNSSYYFATVIANENNRGKLKKHYPTQTHYPLLHKTKYFDEGLELKNSETIHENIINIPLYKNVDLKFEDIWSDSIYFKTEA